MPADKLWTSARLGDEHIYGARAPDMVQALTSTARQPDVAASTPGVTEHLVGCL